MSYSPTQAINERRSQIEEAIKSYDCYTLDRIARQIAKEGDEEDAEKLLALSAKLDDEMTWGYDRFNNN